MWDVEVLCTRTNRPASATSPLLILRKERVSAGATRFGDLKTERDYAYELWTSSLGPFHYLVVLTTFLTVFGSFFTLREAQSIIEECYDICYNVSYIEYATELTFGMMNVRK